MRIRATRPSRKRSALAGLLLLGGACGDTEPGGAAGMGGPANPDGFAAVYAEVIVPNCTASTCHGADAGNLDMSTRASAYANLVGVAGGGPNCVDMGLTRVVPGDSARSLLVAKLDVIAPPCGVPMPVGGMLPADAVARLAAWIDAGALDD